MQDEPIGRSGRSGRRGVDLEAFKAFCLAQKTAGGTSRFDEETTPGASGGEVEDGDVYDIGVVPEPHQVPITALDQTIVTQFCEMADGSDVGPVIEFLDENMIRRFELAKTPDAMRNKIAKHLVQRFSTGHEESDVAPLLAILGHVIDNEFTVHRCDWQKGVDFFDSNGFRQSKALSLKIFNHFWDAVPSNERREVILEKMGKFKEVLNRWENFSGDATDKQFRRALYSREDWTEAFEYYTRTIDRVVTEALQKAKGKTDAPGWIQDIEAEFEEKYESFLKLQKSERKRDQKLLNEQNKEIKKAFHNATTALTLFHAEVDLREDERSEKFKYPKQIREDLKKALGKIKPGECTVLRKPSMDAIEKVMNGTVRSASYALLDDCLNNRLHPFLAGLGRCVGQAVERNWDILKDQPEIACAYMSQYTVFSMFGKLGNKWWSRGQNKLLEVIRTARLRPKELDQKVRVCPISKKVYSRLAVHPLVLEETYNNIKTCSTSLIANEEIQEMLREKMYRHEVAEQLGSKSEAMKVFRSYPYESITLSD